MQTFSVKGKFGHHFILVLQVLNSKDNVHSWDTKITDYCTWKEQQNMDHKTDERIKKMILAKARKEQQRMDHKIDERIKKMIFAKATAEEIIQEMEKWTLSDKSIEFEKGLFQKMKTWVLKGEASIELLEQISVSWINMQIKKQQKMSDLHDELFALTEGQLNTNTMIFNFIEKIDKAALLKEIFTVEFELEEDYKRQIIIQHFRGDEPIKKMRLQKQLTEKYLALYIQKFENKKAAQEYFQKNITKKLFESYENLIDWTIFERGGNCATKGSSFYWCSKNKICFERNKLTCSRCNKVSYCSKECSIKFWPYHKKLCKALHEIASEVD